MRCRGRRGDAGHLEPHGEPAKRTDSANGQSRRASGKAGEGRADGAFDSAARSRQTERGPRQQRADASAASSASATPRCRRDPRIGRHRERGQGDQRVALRILQRRLLQRSVDAYGNR